MRRVLILLALVMLALGVTAAPALAWSHIHTHTAYVTAYGSGWDEWNGPTDPLGTTHHTGAIPHTWPVVLGLTWLDSQTGARLAPVEMLHTFSMHKVNGVWSRKVLNPVRAVRFWDSVYEWDTVGSPGVWAVDWWVPLGKLTEGTYKGWVRERVLSSYPTWLGDSGLVSDPIWSPAFNMRWPQSFKVK